MSSRAFLLVGLVTLLACVCLAIPYAALHSEYAEFRDGTRVTSTVTLSSRTGRTSRWTSSTRMGM